MPPEYPFPALLRGWVDTATGWPSPALHSQNPSSTSGGPWNTWATRDQGKNLFLSPENWQSLLALAWGREESSG